MIGGFFKKFLDFNKKQLDTIQKRVDEVNKLEDKARRLQDADFALETARLKKDIQVGTATLDASLPWAFALVREASRRTLGLRHFDVQLTAAVALYEGRVTEMRTGEGKTLSATPALYLRALTGRGTHLVTVNDYLARRDAGWMGGIFSLLGMTTSSIISGQSFIYDPDYKDSDLVDWRLANLRPVDRPEAYKADITYGINSEFGFDYLRDNMANEPSELAQRGYYFAIIDEADSVLIDEARTPHIISAPFDEDTSKYYQYPKIVGALDPKTHYIVDEKLRTANLTEEGITQIEKILGVTNIYEKDFNTLFHIEAALRAETLYKNDKDYIVRDGEVVIVDEFTGRLLTGRRFSEGIHQAIEAKEGVAIQRESKNLATVSLQNYFRMYEHLSGMTGTAATEAAEFAKIYNLEVVIIPTHRPLVREDGADLIYKTERGKFLAVAAEIAENYKVGRPVLIGTTSIAKNEYLSKLLTQKNIPHKLLNAKNHTEEAAIIANAGRRHAVTVATNVAGRGVDIILGGEPPNKYEINMSNKKEVAEFDKKMLKWQEEHDDVVALGGLYVIGTERHESRRIDNQLRGRAGRQGDPGRTTFYVSLEDDLMRIFGGEQITKIMNVFKFPEDQPLTHSMVSKAIEGAQSKVEGFNFDTRKNLVEYDDVLNKQREIIYTLRRKILELPEKDSVEFKKTVLDTFDEEVTALITSGAPDDSEDDSKVAARLEAELNLITNVPHAKISAYVKAKDWGGLIEYVKDVVNKEYSAREKQIGVELWSGIVRSLFLSTVDKYWTEHLTAIDSLREGIGLRAYAQLDPLVQYKNEAFTMFEQLIGDIDFEVTRRILRVQVDIARDEAQHEHHHHHHAENKKLEYQSAAAIDPYKKKREKQITSSPTSKDLTTSKKSDAKKDSSSELLQSMGITVTPPGVTKTKLGRNDPCWCGSGRKFKKCHYPQLPG